MGKAKVTFSFDDWLEGRVERSTIELPVAKVGNRNRATEAAKQMNMIRNSADTQNRAA